MSDKNKSLTTLDPQGHQGAVRLFFNYFNIQPAKPDWQHLETILRHFSAIPYENISKIIKLEKGFTSLERIRLPAEVMEDFARYHLGGTCFSLTFFLQTILADQGFICYPVIASMRNRPNAHCALIVLFEQKPCLVDPGYLLTRPMELSKDNPRHYRTEHTGVELTFNRNNEHFFLCTFDRNQKKWRYFFQNMPVPPNLFLQYWYDSFYKSSMHGICLTQVRQDGLAYVHKDLLQISNLNSKQKFKISSNYHQIIQEIFNIAPEWVEHALQAIEANTVRQKKMGLFQKNERTFLNETD